MSSSLSVANQLSPTALSQHCPFLDKLLDAAVPIEEPLELGRGVLAACARGGQNQRPMVAGVHGHRKTIGYKPDIYLLVPALALCRPAAARQGRLPYSAHADHR